MTTSTITEANAPVINVGDCYKYGTLVVMLCVVKGIDDNLNETIDFIFMAMTDQYIGRSWNDKTYSSLVEAHDYITGDKCSYLPFKGKVILNCE